MRKSAALVQRPLPSTVRQQSTPDTLPTSRHQPASQLRAVLLSGMLLVLLWQMLVAVAQIPTWLLPGPLAVGARLRTAWLDGTLMQHIVPTVIESVGGFALALLAGALAGYGVAHSRRLERWVAPYIAAAQAIPVIAVAPLIVIWFGYDSDVLRNTVIAAIVVVFPIFSSTLTGVRTIPRELREVALVEGANRWQRLRFIELPLALPVLFSGMRTSLAYATTGAVVGEFVGSRYGLGALINIARGFWDTPLIFVALLCLGTITLLLYLVLIGVERLTLRWLE